MKLMMKLVENQLIGYDDNMYTTLYQMLCYMLKAAFVIRSRLSIVNDLGVMKLLRKGSSASNETKYVHQAD